MKKGLLGTFLLTLIMVVLFIPEKAQAGHDIGILSNENPCVYARFSLGEGGEYYCFLNVKGDAGKTYISIENLSGGNASLKADFINITGGESSTVKSISLKSGKKKVSKALPDFKDGDMYFIEIKNPKLSGVNEASFGLCIYSEKLGGVKHNFSKVKVSADELYIKEGDSLKLKATLNKSIKAAGVTWKSSNQKVVTVSKNGKITAKGEGYAVITCTSKKDKSFSAQCHVIVEKKESTIPDEKTKYVWKYVGSYVSGTQENGMQVMHHNIDERHADGEQNYADIYCECEIPPALIEVDKEFSLKIKIHGNVIRNDLNRGIYVSCKASIAPSGLDRDATLNAGTSMTPDDYNALSWGNYAGGFGDNETIVRGKIYSSNYNEGDTISIYFRTSFGQCEWKYCLAKA